MTDPVFFKLLDRIKINHDISTQEITFKNLEFFIGGFCLKNGEFYLPTEIKIKYSDNKNEDTNSVKKSKKKNKEDSNNILHLFLYVDSFTTKGKNRIEYNNRLKLTQLDNSDYNHCLHIEYAISQYKLDSNNIFDYMLNLWSDMYNRYRYIYDKYVEK